MEIFLPRTYLRNPTWFNLGNKFVNGCQNSTKLPLPIKSVISQISAGSVRHMRCIAGIFSVRSPFVAYKKERVESEAEIGSSEFRAGEFTCGFVERLPKR